MQFIGVAWYGDDTSFQGFVDKYHLSFPQISDNPGDVFARFGVPYQPAMPPFLLKTLRTHHISRK